jgi:hypothetical protein
MTFAQSKRSFVLLVVVLTALAATCLDLAAAATALVTPAGAAPVSTKAPSDLAARIRVLAGDPDHVLVGISRVGPGRHAYRGSERVYVVDQHGHRDGIGRVGDFETGWSVNGDIVTAVSATSTRS